MNIYSFFSGRKVLLSLAWLIVSIPLTLVLTVPSTTPAAEYARALARTQRLEPLWADASSFAAKGGDGVSDRFSRYLSDRALERERHAEVYPWSQRLATLGLLLITMCIVPAWFVITTLAKRQPR